MMNDDEFDHDDEAVEPDDGSTSDDSAQQKSAATQFGVGQKRNLKGRPIVRKDRQAIVRRIANKRMKIIEQGKSIRLSYIEILLRQIRNREISGNLAAGKVAEKARRYSATVEAGVPRASPGFAEPAANYEEWIEKRSPEGLAAFRERWRILSSGAYDEIEAAYLAAKAELLIKSNIPEIQEEEVSENNPTETAVEPPPLRMTLILRPNIDR